MPRICPVCDAEVRDKKLTYFAQIGSGAEDHDILHQCTEVERVAAYLGALAAAAPRAIVHCEDYMPEWAMDLAVLAEELSDELQRRLQRLEKVGLHWKHRAEALENAQGKEQPAAPSVPRYTPEPTPTAPEDED
jgi:hypothetical protein